MTGFSIQVYILVYDLHTLLDYLLEIHVSGLKTEGLDFAAHQARRRTEDRPWSILSKSELSEKFPKVQAFANKWFEVVIGSE